ncbi:ATP-binding protein [Photobacterium profundum]|uniref:hybrid sensor histidine kinase/response regulator n=1 Tax=Photobacterium profundum TaxID=74109 RepID=UPI003D0C2BA0
MGFLNKISIKSRLFLLVGLPLLFMSVFAGLEIKKLYGEVQSLNLLNARIELLKEQYVISSQVHTLKTERLVGDIELNEWNALSEAINSAFLLLPSAFSQSEKEGAENILKEMDEAKVELLSTSKEDLNDWSVWFDDLVSQFLITFEKNRVSTGNIDIEKNTEVLYQLQWLSFWAQEENWFIHQYKETNNNEFKQLLSTVIERQQLFIDRFIAISASPKQIDLLLKIFADPAFSDSYKLREGILTGEMKESEIATGLQAFNDRFSLIQQVVQEVSISLVDDIQTTTTDIKKLMSVYLAAILLSMVVMCYLGTNLARRILFYLSRVIQTMSKIEEDHNAALKVKSDGNDEFTVFTSKLNQLLEDRHFSQANIIKAKEEAEKANVAKSSFLANMSHEIRTPLNGIIGMSGILSDTELNPSQAEYLQTIETSSQTLLLLINDILDLSKIESGNLVLSPHESNLAEVVYDTITIVQAKASEQGLNLQIQLDPELPTSVMLDEHRLRQVLMNLMSNAVKFTLQGSVTLSITYTDIGDKKASLLFSIKDTGIGIEKDKQQQVFAPFTQEDGSITRQFGGTGLGLAICRQLVELLGGSIELKSEKGFGSDFYFSLDVDVVKYQPKLIPNFENKKCLLLSNQTSNADKVEMECKKWGLNITVSDIETAAVLGISQQYDLILYCQKTLNRTIKDIELFNRIQDRPALVICSQLQDEQFDFGHTIDGLTVLPLLGQRFVKAISNAFTNVVKNREIQATPALNPESRLVDIKPVSINTTPAITDGQISEQADADVILIVEDNLVNQKVASLLLKKAGYQIVLANNGQEAVDLITQKEPISFKAILMDCMMPIMDGFAATEAIRVWEKEQQTDRLPIIALTASVLDEDISKCYEAGMDDYVAKPFRKEHLLDKLESLNEVA